MRLWMLMVLAAAFVAGCNSERVSRAMALRDGVVLLNGEIADGDLISSINLAHKRGSRCIYIGADGAANVVDFAKLLWDAGASNFGTNVWIETKSGMLHIWSSLLPSGDVPVVDQARALLPFDLRKKGVLIGPRRYSTSVADIDSFVGRLLDAPFGCDDPFAVIFTEAEARCDLLLNIWDALCRQGCRDCVLLFYRDFPEGVENAVEISPEGGQWRNFPMKNAQYLRMAYMSMTGLHAGVANNDESPISVSVPYDSGVESVLATARLFGSVGGRSYIVCGEDLDSLLFSGRVAHSSTKDCEVCYNVHMCKNGIALSQVWPASLVRIGNDACALPKDASQQILAPKPYFRISSGCPAGCRFYGVYEFLKACAASGVKHAAYEIPGAKPDNFTKQGQKTPVIQHLDNPSMSNTELCPAAQVEGQHD